MPYITDPTTGAWHYEPWTPATSAVVQNCQRVERQRALLADLFPWIGPYPIYLAGGARGWTDKPPRARQVSGWRVG